ncbi:MAG: hypothetical protein K9N06_14025 [Candidatus Cloacimonetes bacterium]|nr:hypothetical protein [Candidatus Cloacimonadota bacterium]
MEEKPLLRWTSHPLLDFPLTSVILIIFMLLISIILFKTTVISWEAPLYFYLGMLFFIGSLITWFIPTTYEIYEDKLLIHYAIIKVEKEWSQFHCWYADKKGVLLSTFHRPRRLDGFRGQSLRFSKTRAEKEELFRLLSEKAGKEY